MSFFASFIYIASSSSCVIIFFETSSFGFIFLFFATLSFVSGWGLGFPVFEFPKLMLIPFGGGGGEVY